MAEEKNIQKLIETLHPLEQKVLPLLIKHTALADIVDASGLSQVEVMRALQWMENKDIIKIKAETKELISLEKNGKDYLKKGLPENRFLIAIKDSALAMQEIIKKAGLDKEELNACIGMLKKKAAINFNDQKIEITEQGKKLLGKESLEDKFLKQLSHKTLSLADLSPEEKFAYDVFSKRKDIIKTVLTKERTTKFTELGRKIASMNLNSGDALERLTPDMLKKGTWKGKKFRRYDVKINVPAIDGGKKHFVNQAIGYAKKIWLEMGFTEMEGNMINTSFWNFDALFTAQDHPVRELQDTFYIKDPKSGKLPDPKLVKKVKAMHEHGGDIGSKGWMYKWSEDDAKLNVLRTHTTVLSSTTLAKLKKEDYPAKFFAVGRCFRNEALDWSHLFEFNQTEGIVIDPDANFRNLLGYLKEFFKKMGYPKARFRPAFFPYTEPSIEIDIFHPVHKKWLEFGGAGMLRPEVVEPLLGKDVPVLAWGPGFDRIILEYYNITDIRDLYRNDLKQIREMKSWMK